MACHSRPLRGRRGAPGKSGHSATFQASGIKGEGCLTTSVCEPDFLLVNLAVLPHPLPGHPGGPRRRPHRKGTHRTGEATPWLGASNKRRPGARAPVTPPLSPAPVLPTEAADGSRGPPPPPFPGPVRAPLPLRRRAQVGAARVATPRHRPQRRPARRRPPEPRRPASRRATAPGGAGTLLPAAGSAAPRRRRSPGNRGSRTKAASPGPGDSYQRAPRAPTPASTSAASSPPPAPPRPSPPLPPPAAARRPALAGATAPSGGRLWEAAAAARKAGAGVFSREPGAGGEGGRGQRD